MRVIQLKRSEGVFFYIITKDSLKFSGSPETMREPSASAE